MSALKPLLAVLALACGLIEQPLPVLAAEDDRRCPSYWNKRTATAAERKKGCIAAALANPRDGVYAYRLYKFYDAQGDAKKASSALLAAAGLGYDRATRWLLFNPLQAAMNSADPEGVTDWLLAQARAGDERAAAALADGALFEELFFQAVRYQNGVLEPRERALDFYAAALRDPEQRWHGITAFHVDRLAEGETTFGTPYETDAMASARWDRWHDWRKSRARQAAGRLGQTGQLDFQQGGMTAGEVFLALVAATVVMSVSDGLSGQAPPGDPATGSTGANQADRAIQGYAESLWLQP